MEIRKLSLSSKFIYDFEVEGEDNTKKLLTTLSSNYIAENKPAVNLFRPYKAYYG